METSRGAAAVEARRFAGDKDALRYPPIGFNSHACTKGDGVVHPGEFIPCAMTKNVKSYGWTASDMYEPGMFAMHTKLTDLACPASG